MRINPNILISEMSGKLEKFVVTTSKGSSAGNILSIRKYSKPYNPNTSSQQDVRAAFAAAITFFNTAANTTIGATSFVRADFLSYVRDATAEADFRGVPTDGDYAGRQLWIGQVVSLKASVPLIVSGVLPQTAADEPELIALLSEVDDIIAAIETAVQKDRIGFID